MAELDLDVDRWRMQRRGGPPPVIGEAVLRNYPLRLFQLQREHMAAVVQEFDRVQNQHDAGQFTPPQHVFDVAEMFRTVFGAMIQAVYEERQRAFEAGCDRMDSRVPLIKKTPDYLDHFRLVFDAVDEFSRQGLLKTPPRPLLVAALLDWTMSELTAQYFGADPTPWAGPF